MGVAGGTNTYIQQLIYHQIGVQKEGVVGVIFPNGHTGGLSNIILSEFEARLHK